MSYSIKKDKGFVIVELAKGKEFEIEINQFKTTRTLENGLTSCCDLFIHIKQTKKEWVDDNLFYDLVLIINEEIPDHEINWVNTFIAIEQENYSDYLLTEEANDKSVDILDEIDKVFEDSEVLNEEFSKREVRSGLKEQVEGKLRARGII